MPCYNPIKGYRAKNLNENGKRPLVFKEKDSDGSDPIDLPCGRCYGCRLEYSRQWAVRCHHEAQMHEHNSFLTLTYAPEYLPEDNSVHKEELQKFFKKLRRTLDYHQGKKIRYFACGEYGETLNRPHYHALIFGYDFPDKVLHKKTKSGDLLFTSKQLDALWGKGWAYIGNVTFQSAAYVARYVMKKRKGDPDNIDPKTGKSNKEHYQIVDSDTGEIHQLEPEFCIMSRNPGIAKNWFDTYQGDLDKDFITLSGAKMKLPKYYDYLLEKYDYENWSDDFQQRKQNRQNNASQDGKTIERLRTLETVKKAQTKSLTRELEQINEN
jgi:hypothetical protein